MADAIVLREFKVKTGSVKRLSKEIMAYEEEVKQLQTKLDKMRDEDPTQYAIKKQEEMLTETKTVIQDCYKKLLQARDNLELLIEKNKDSLESDEAKAALQVLEQYKKVAS